MSDNAYKVSVTWMQDREGTAQTPDVRERLFFSAPPEFGGQPGLWSPESLLVLSAASCFLSTFLFFVEREKRQERRRDREHLERVFGVGRRQVGDADAVVADAVITERVREEREVRSAVVHVPVVVVGHERAAVAHGSKKRTRLL